MKIKILCVLSIIVSPFLATASGPGAAEFRGYVKTNTIVRERMLKPGTTFELGQYVGQSYDPFGTNLLDLLGTNKSGFAGGRFRNGAPNSLNMLVWHMLFSKLAADISALCSGSENLDFTDGFKAAVIKLCDDQAGLRQRDEALFGFWLAIMSFDAPLSEYEEWRKFWSSDPGAGSLSGAEAVEWMAISIMNNPYFLLRL